MWVWGVYDGTYRSQRDSLKDEYKAWGDKTPRYNTHITTTT